MVLLSSAIACQAVPRTWNGLEALLIQTGMRLSDTYIYAADGGEGGSGKWRALILEYIVSC